MKAALLRCRGWLVWRAAGLWAMAGMAVLAVPARCADPVLAGTQPLAPDGDRSARMHEAAIREVDRQIAEAARDRAKSWPGRAAEHRARLCHLLGLQDGRAAAGMERYGDEENPALVAETSRYRVHQVRWPVLDRVTGEGLLLEPRSAARGFVVALPDAGQTPEQAVGLAPGVAPERQFARRLAENGCTVLVPVLIDRGTAGSGTPGVGMTNEPHREWIHRQAWMMGRTLIGLEVQKVLAAVDWHEARGRSGGRGAGGPVGVAGYGEGGLVAFYAAACDERIAGALVSGYFKPREGTWAEPLYRDVWGLLREFGDAEIASLIAPRAFVAAYAAEPEASRPPPLDRQKSQAAPGTLVTPRFEEVEAEFARIGAVAPEESRPWRRLVRGDAEEACAAFGTLSGIVPQRAPIAGGNAAGTGEMPLSAELPRDSRRSFDPLGRQLRQVRELNDFIQRLVRDSDRARDEWFLHRVLPEFASVPWNYTLRFPRKDATAFVSAAKDYRRVFREDILGELRGPLPAPNARTRLVYDEPKWTGYEVTLDAGGESFAWGVLLIPKGIRSGERRPVVVCQHGRNGVPADVIEGDKAAYHDFAARLAADGFIVLAPHNLYRNEPVYRLLARKAHTIGATHWSLIVRHHEQWLAWLASLPEVDPARIGFYGLSFGGEAAMRVPSLLEGYALSICSGDFNDWTRKVASTHDRKSFMFSDEWEIGCFGMGAAFSYAELSYLIFPRPFMVERGHHDGVAQDSWVASEYAKTRWFYDQFGFGERTAIEFFNGGHVINGEGTFEFLRKHLRWP